MNTTPTQEEVEEAKAEIRSWADDARRELREAVAILGDDHTIIPEHEADPERIEAGRLRFYRRDANGTRWYKPIYGVDPEPDEKAVEARLSRLESRMAAIEAKLEGTADDVLD